MTVKTLTLAWTCLLLTIPCSAAIIVVDPNGTGDYPTIQAAIIAANPGDEVVLRQGTYTGEGNRDIDFGGKAITVRSLYPDDPNVVAATIVDPKGIGRGFSFGSGEDANSVLEGLTIANGYIHEGFGYPDGGGAIFCNLSGPLISKCVIRDNGAQSESYGGAGIFCIDSSSTIRDCSFSNNWAYGDSYGGGGISLWNSSVTIANCTFTNNSGEDGGGIFIQGQNTGEVKITDCIFIGNRAREDEGGGISIYSSAGSVIVTNCMFTENLAPQGGGIATYSGSGCDLTVINCTFTGNSGSGIYNGNSSLSVTNCILWGNNGEIHGTASVAYSCVQGGHAGTGNIDADPNFAKPGYWDGDVWVDGDYHLKSQAGRWYPNTESWITDTVTSPCIDKGNPGSPLGDEPVDPNNLRINMGAYGGTAEASKTPSGWGLLSDLTNDGTVSLNDLLAQIEYWLETGNKQPGDLDRNGPVNLADFVLLAGDWLEQTSWY